MLKEVVVKHLEGRNVVGKKNPHSITVFRDNLNIWWNKIIKDQQHNLSLCLIVKVRTFPHISTHMQREFKGLSGKSCFIYCIPIAYCTSLWRQCYELWFLQFVRQVLCPQKVSWLVEYIEWLNFSICVLFCSLMVQVCSNMMVQGLIWIMPQPVCPIIRGKDCPMSY